MQIAISVNTAALGDTLAAIPTIRKVSKAYETPITVFTQFPELFQNHPCVKEAFPLDASKEGYNVLNTFLHIAGRDHTLLGNHVQFKHSHIDIRQYHAISLGFSLLPEEMEIDLYVEEPWNIDFKNYAIIHPTFTWGSRTWSQENWQKLVYELNSLNIPVVAIGKKTIEQGYRQAYHKETMEINIPYGINLMGHPESTFPKLRNLFSQAKCLITMDSGILHLAGTTDVHIIQLGSSIDPKLRAPYRNGTQDYKYNYVKGECDLFCASNLKYNVKVHNSIQGVPPLDKCLENKPTFECHSKVNSVINVVKMLPNIKQKLMYITPHLSTGGMPQYVLKQIETFKAKYNISLIEYEQYSDTWVVQRNKVIDLLPKENFFSLGKGGNNKPKVLDIINKVKPDIIHFQEDPETFIHEDILTKLINLPNRPYYITTTHSSYSKPERIKFIPDKFVLVSEWSKQKFENIVDVPCDIWEYPIEDLKSEKKKYQQELGFDKNYFHVVNVGLFTRGKNQGEVFKIAEQLQDLPIKFHFVGNQAMNFQDYWEPLIKNKSDNCVVWGERNDVNKFLQASDLFYFSSVLELNPLVVKEALSYKLPILMRRLHTYLDQYDNNSLVSYINDNLEVTKQLIKNKFKL